MVRNIMMALLVLTVFASDSLAQGLFRRSTNRPDAAEYVPALIKTLQADADERKRAVAGEQLRHYDLKAFPEIMPALIEALKNDPSHSVRHEVVNTIGKLRPISQAAGFALEQAAANDNSFRVRAAAKTNLVQWTLLHGYRQGRATEAQPSQTEEPPLAQPLSKMGTSYKNGPVIPASTATVDRTEPIRPPLMPNPVKPSIYRSLFPLFSPSSRSSNKSGTNGDGPALNPPK